jgi:hypothetical protein
MATKYEKHATDKGKYQSTIDEYGHGIGNGKSRQAVSKNHNKIIDSQGVTVAEAVEVPDSESEPNVIESEPDVSIPSPEPPTPDWLNIEFDGSEVDEQVQSIPAPIRGLLGAMSGQMDPHAVKTPAQMQAWYAQQARLVRYFLAGIADPALSWWARGITANPEFTIERSHQEWEMTEAVTEQFLHHNQISVMVNPNLLMGGMMAALYVPPVVKAVRERDPNRKGVVGGWLQRWRQRRAIRKALKENPHLEPDDLEMD